MARDIWHNDPSPPSLFLDYSWTEWMRYGRKSGNDHFYQPSDEWGQGFGPASLANMAFEADIRQFLPTSQQSSWLPWPSHEDVGTHDPLDSNGAFSKVRTSVAWVLLMRYSSTIRLGACEVEYYKALHMQHSRQRLIARFALESARK